MPLFFLLACAEAPSLPEGADRYDVTVTATDDTCHDTMEPYEERVDYAIFLRGRSADLYVGEQLFATGAIDGCDLSYQTAVYNNDTQSDGNVKWRLFGTATLDRGDDSCVDGEADWEGEEVFEVVDAPSDTIEPGCTYTLTTTGVVVRGTSG